MDVPCLGRVGILRPRTTPRSLSEASHIPHSAIPVIHHKFSIEDPVEKPSLELYSVRRFFEVSHDRAGERLERFRSHVQAVYDFQSSKIGPLMP